MISKKRIVIEKKPSQRTISINQNVVNALEFQIIE